MERPTWQDREAWALTEAARHLDRGLLPPPTLLCFEGDEATLYVRGGPKVGEVDQKLAWGELFALGWTLRPEGALLLTTVRLRTDADDALLGEAEGEAGVTVAWARRRGEGEAHEYGAALFAYGVDDAGAFTWRDREDIVAGGPLEGPLTAAVTGRWPADDRHPDGRPADVGMPPSGLAYALSRYGLTVGVADGWFERYGFHVPIDPHDVRREDRRRARARWDRRRELTEVSS